MPGHVVGIDGAWAWVVEHRHGIGMGMRWDGHWLQHVNGMGIRMGTRMG